MHYERKIPETMFLLKFTHCYVFVFLLFLFTSPATAALESKVIHHQDGSITVSAQKMKLRGFLDELAEVTGIEIYLIGGLHTESVYVDFNRASLQTVLRRVLKGSSYAIVSNGSDRNDRNKIFTLSDALSKAPTGAVASQSTAQKAIEKRPYLSRGHNATRSLDPIFQSKRGDSVAIVSEGAAAHAERSTPDHRGIASASAEPAMDENAVTKESENVIRNNAASGIDEREKQILVYEHRIEELQARIESGASDRHYDHWSKIRGSKYIQHDSEQLSEYQDRLDELRSQ